MEKEMLAAIRSGREDRFYNSWAWRKKRLEIISRDNNECQICKDEGRVGSADVVHHVKHLKDHPKLGMKDSNLLTVCSHCHNVLHPEKQRRVKVECKPINEERW